MNHAHTGAEFAADYCPDLSTQQGDGYTICTGGKVRARN